MKLTLRHLPYSDFRRIQARRGLAFFLALLVSVLHDGGVL